MTGYRHAAICRSQWDMAIYLHLSILSKTRSKNIMSHFTIHDIMENSFETFDKYIIPLFGPNRNNSTRKETFQNRLNHLCKNNEFMGRVPREYYYLTDKGVLEATRVYNKFVDLFSDANNLISANEIKFINSKIDDFNSFFINIEKAYEILIKFKIISQDDANLNLLIINKRKSGISLSKPVETQSIIDHKNELINNPKASELLKKLGISPKEALKISLKNTKV